VIVADLDLIGVPVHEPKAYAPLIIDCDGMLSLPIAPESVQPVAWRYLEVIQRRREMDVLKLPNSASSDVGRKPSCPARREEVLRPPIRERLDQQAM
jgi:hypothetical protein